MRLVPERLVPLLCVLLLGACEPVEPEEVALGTLERDRIELRADSDEPIVERLVREGDVVTAGTPLLRQDDRAAVAAHAMAAARVAAARQALAEAEHGPRAEEFEQVRARLAAARSDVSIARIELRRARELRSRAFTSENDVDVLAARAAQAEAREAELAARLAELERGTREEIVARLRDELRVAEESVVAAELALERTTLRAPVDGIVEALPFETGERPPRGATVVALLRAGTLHARVHLPAPLRARLAPGAAAEVRVEGLAEPYDARVRWIAAEAAFTPYFALTQQDASRLSYVAEIDLARDADLPVGVPVSVAFPGRGE